VMKDRLEERLLETREEKLLIELTSLQQDCSMHSNRYVLFKQWTLIHTIHYSHSPRC
jgi:hypothetical protein